MDPGASHFVQGRPMSKCHSAYPPVANIGNTERLMIEITFYNNNDLNQAGSGSSYSDNVAWLPKLSTAMGLQLAVIDCLPSLSSVKLGKPLSDCSNFLAQYLNVAYLIDSCLQNAPTVRPLLCQRRYSSR